MLVHHVKSDGRFIGTVVAVDKNIIGWSQCCDKERVFWYNRDNERIDIEETEGWDTKHIPADKFDKKLGIIIAEGRAINGSTTEPTHDERGQLLHSAMKKMRLRSQRYFKLSPYEYEQQIRLHLDGCNITYE